MEIADNQKCPFCTLNPMRIIASNVHSLVIMDGFPISPGHALIIPKRHIASLFDATMEEREALFDLLEIVKIETQKAVELKFNSLLSNNKTKLKNLNIIPEKNQIATTVKKEIFSKDPLLNQMLNETAQEGKWRNIDRDDSMPPAAYMGCLLPVSS